jgi:hypothetical protein
MSTIPDLYPRHKVPEEVRECNGCHLKVIARGDQAGWKGVDAGGGNLKWFCDKSPCQQQREEFIARRQAEMVAEQRAAQEAAQDPARRPVEELDDTEAQEEEKRLKARLLALKTRKVQSTAEPEATIVSPQEDERVLDELAKAAEPTSESNDSGLFEGVTVHQTKDGLSSVCGGEGAIFAVGEELPDSCVPCVDCAELIEDKESPTEPTVGVYDPEGGKVGQVPVSQVKPPQMDLEKLPKFTPELITKISVDGYDGGHILIPPSAYPDINMEGTDPERLREGVSAFFQGSGLEVGTIKRARKGEQFLGVVFDLKAEPKK